MSGISDTMVHVDGIWKQYGLPFPKLYSRLRYQLSSLKGTKSEVRSDDGTWALRDLGFDVIRGEVLGVIGRNGAGKSTLLKILAGVTPATRGSVSVEGSIFPMIELNAGMHMDLTGRENVHLLGAIMGIRRSDVNSRIPVIEEFCELGEWFDRPVRMYSSGMLARLGFAVAMNVDTEILLVDEVLAVGDIGFQNRCLRTMKERHLSSKTIVFVSHSMDMVQYLCDRVLWLSNGQSVLIGEPEQVITAYENATYAKDAMQQKALQEATLRHDTDQFRLSDTHVIGTSGNSTDAVQAYRGLRVEFRFMTNLPIAQLVFSFALLNQRHEACLWEYCNGDTLVMAGRLSERSGSEFTLQLDIPPLPLSGGMYIVNFMVRDRHTFAKLCHYKGLSPFYIQAEHRERGILSVPITWRCEPGGIPNAEEN